MNYSYSVDAGYVLLLFEYFHLGYVKITVERLKNLFFESFNWFDHIVFSFGNILGSEYTTNSFLLGMTRLSFDFFWGWLLGVMNVEYLAVLFEAFFNTVVVFLILE